MASFQPGASSQAVASFQPGAPSQAVASFQPGAPSQPTLLRRTFGASVLATAAASVATLNTSFAAAAPFSSDEIALLENGGLLERPVDTEFEGETYMGGVSYSIVNAPAAFVLAILQNVAVYKTILSLTLEAEAKGKKGNDTLVYFKHGGRLGTAGYTMRVQPADKEGVVRFWMDREFDHEIEDVWGFVRVEPRGKERCLATYGVLCDLGTLLRIMFGERIRSYALETPSNLKRLAEGDFATLKSGR